MGDKRPPRKGSMMVGRAVWAFLTVGAGDVLADTTNLSHPHADASAVGAAATPAGLTYDRTSNRRLH